MAQQNLTNYDAVLKEFYIDKIVETIKQEMPLMEFFKKRDDMPTDGRRVVYPVHVQRNSGRGARGESGRLPTAGSQLWQDYQVPYRYNHARIQLSAQVMKASKTSKGAFEKAFDAEIMGAAKDLGRDRNRQLFGFGRGDLCQLNGALSNGTAAVVKNCQGLTGANGQFNIARFVAANDLLAFVTTAGALDAVGTVSSVNAALSTITLSSGVTASDGDYIVRASTTSDVIGDTAYNNEIMGLLGMIDDTTFVTTYNGISRSTYPTLQAARLDLAGGPLSQSILQKGFDLIDQKGNGKADVAWMHHTTLREHLSSIVTTRRYINEAGMKADAGWKGAAHKGEIEFNEIPLKVDRDCPYGMIFLLDSRQLFRYVLEEGKWADEDGTILLRLSGSDDYEARFRVFDQFIDDAPNTACVISTIGLSATPETVQVI